ncbi:MAG: acetyl-CoA carboxylase biotin carboxyl carrier protein [Weeksellaceae bacterium]|nr:acetyl-CoA carboxylase biotin carboxyl carrier protein [Weeksellaceae bacterium]
MDLKELQNLIRFISKTDVAEVEIDTEEFSLVVKNVASGNTVASYQTPMFTQAPAMPSAPSEPAAASAPQAPTTDTDTSGDDSKYVAVKSPMIGTFYRKPGPDKPVFVNVGDEVKKGDVVCIIEAMKLFNEIESEVSGKVVKVLVDDATPVEYDQPLFLVDPS